MEIKTKSLMLVFLSMIFLISFVSASTTITDLNISTDANIFAKDTINATGEMNINGNPVSPWLYNQTGESENIFDQPLNTSSNVTFANITITNNSYFNSDLNVRNSFFANIIGSIVDRIVILWVTTINAVTLNANSINATNVNVTETLNVSGEINIDGSPVSPFLYNQTEAGQELFLNLSGTNANQKIRLEPFTTSVPTPLAPNDSANKEYVDDAVAGINFDFFLNDGPSDITGYFNMTEEDLDVAETSLTSPSLPLGVTTIFNFTTLEGQPEFKMLIGGIYDAHIHLQKSSPGREVKIFWELYNRTGSVENLLLTGETSPFITDNDIDYDLHGVLLNEEMINSGDRLIFKLIAIVSGGGANPTVTLTMQGTSDSHFTIRTTTGAFEAIFLRQDGSKPLVDNWNVGDFDITNVNNFLADIIGSITDRITNIWVSSINAESINVTSINASNMNITETLNVTGEININNAPISKWLYNQSSTNETTRFGLLIDNDCPGALKMIGVQPNGTITCSAVAGGGDFSFTDYQNSFNLNISKYELRVNASYLSSFNQTYLGAVNNATYLSSFNASYNNSVIWAYNQTGLGGISTNPFNQILNFSSNVTFANITITNNSIFSGDLEVVNSFFADIIGSITDRITNLWASAIDTFSINANSINSSNIKVTETINITGEVNIGNSPVSPWLYNQTFSNNIFNQQLNTTNNVVFGNITSLGNLTITGNVTTGNGNIVREWNGTCENTYIGGTLVQSIGCA